MPVSRRTGVNITAIARSGGASIGRTAVVPFFKRLTSSSWQFLSDRVPDRIMLARRFKREFGRAPNLKNPRTFNEKLLWLMLYYRTPLATRLADKYEVRGYVAERVGPERLNELYGVWDRVSDIDFDTLPDAFVLKVNWGWGANVFCRRRSELDVPKTKEQLAAWMRRSHYWSAREWCYKNIEPRIVCERLLTDDRWGIPPDYKFFCFGGEPRFVKVHTDRFGQHGRGLFDLDWQVPPFGYGPPSTGQAIPRPDNLDEMLHCARSLSRGLPFVRVDLYSVAGHTIFGEMTWQPSAGMGRFVPDRYNEYWGDALPLPAKTRSRLSRARA
jgi:TupA-like ATPgrasp